jgi:hypothetical protein
LEYESMTENKETSKKSNGGLKKAGILIGGVVVVAAAGAASWYYFFRSTAPQKLSPLQSAELVPEDALLTSYIYTDTKAWSKLQEFGTPELKKLVEQNQQNLQQELFEGSDITFQEDIKPWAGGMMLAYMPKTNASATDSENSQPNSPSNSEENAQPESQQQSQPQTAEANPPEGSILAVVGIKNKAKALTFFNNMKGKEGTQVQETEYKGVTVFEVTQPENTNYFARVGNHLLLSPNNQDIKRAIDTSKGETSFADNSNAANILKQGTKIQNPIAQVYVTDYSRLVQQLSAASPDAPQLSEGTLSQLQNIKHIIAGVGVDNEGIRMRFVSQIDPSNLPEGYQQNSPGEVLKQFPQDTVALITGNGINRVWSQLKTQAEENPQVKQLVDQIRSRLQSFNLDADKEVFNWMDGEFGIGSVTLSSNSGIFGQFGMGIAMVMQTSDRSTAESTLQKVQDIAKQQAPFLNISDKKVGDVQVTQWQLPGQDAILGHGWLDDNSLFLALGNGLSSDFVRDGGQNLSSSSQFQEVTQTLPQSNVGYFYLDMDKVVSVIDNLPQVANNGLPPETQAVLNSMNGIGVTANWVDKSTSQLEMLVSLKETGEIQTESPQSESQQSETQPSESQPSETEKPANQAE